MCPLGTRRVVGSRKRRPRPPSAERLRHLHKRITSCRGVSRTTTAFAPFPGFRAARPRLTRKNASPALIQSEPQKPDRTDVVQPRGGRYFKYRPSGRYPKHRPPLGCPETPPSLHVVPRRSAAAVRQSLASRGSLALPLEHLVACPLGSRDKHVTNDGGAVGCRTRRG